MGPSIVKKRCVFALGGYEPVPPERQRERFVRELRRFERTWNVACTVSDMTLSEDAAAASWQVETRAPNWHTHTDYHLLRWDDFVAADFGRSQGNRLLLALLAFGNFIWSGTAWRYVRTNWRYGLFFLYPLLAVALFAVVALAAGSIPILWDWRWAYLFAPLIAAAVFVALFGLVGPKLLLPYIFDDWIFAYEFVHRSRAGIAERMEAFAQKIAEVLRAGGYDEIVVSGHSLGAAWKLAVVDRALSLAPEFGRNGEKLCLLSTGSSLLKVALHPAAKWLAQAVLRVAHAQAVFWIEYQALVDVISFYKTNPVAALSGKASDKPLIQKLRIRHMLDDAAYRRFRGNFFRLHRQLVMGNDKRYFYDFFMVCCGPFTLPARAADPERMMQAFAADGALQAAPKSFPLALNP